MCPEGATHLPYRGAVKVCKRLQIDYAEAVVGFEFGNRMAVPVIQGVVIAEENQDLVMEELEKDEIERARKEDEKRRKKALGKWRKFLMGMRVVERIRQDYGEVNENMSIFGPSERGLPRDSATKRHQDEQTAGGFLPENYEEAEEDEEEAPTHQTSGFFATAADEEGEAGNDGLVVEHNLDGESSPNIIEAGSEEVPANAPKAKRSRRATKPAAGTKRRSTRGRQRKLSEDTETDEDEKEPWDGDSSDDEWR